jgi:hypothetical protein
MCNGLVEAGCCWKRQNNNKQHWDLFRAARQKGRIESSGQNLISIWLAPRPGRKRHPKLSRRAWYRGPHLPAPPVLPTTMQWKTDRMQISDVLCKNLGMGQEEGGTTLLPAEFETRDSISCLAVQAVTLPLCLGFIIRHFPLQTPRGNCAAKAGALCSTASLIKAGLFQYNELFRFCRASGYTARQVRHPMMHQHICSTGGGHKWTYSVTACSMRKSLLGTPWHSSSLQLAQLTTYRTMLLRQEETNEEREPANNWHLPAGSFQTIA